MRQVASLPSINQHEQIALFKYEYHWNGNPKLEAEGFYPSRRLQQSIEYAVRRLCSSEVSKTDNNFLINFVFVEAFFCQDCSGQDLIHKVVTRLAKMHDWHTSCDRMPSNRPR
jgi:hypothetical protein